MLCIFTTKTKLGKKMMSVKKIFSGYYNYIKIHLSKVTYFNHNNTHIFLNTQETNQAEYMVFIFMFTKMVSILNHLNISLQILLIA